MQVNSSNSLSLAMASSPGAVAQNHTRAAYPGAAAQTRVVSLAAIRLGSWESARAFKAIICVDVSEFESHMPSHAVGLSQMRGKHFPAPLPPLPGLLALLLKYAYAQTGKNSVAPANIFFKRDWL
jgi:hypothetical protein